jgi:FtsH-binding integral membrane protein
MIGNLIFTVYLVYDTQTMVSGTKYEWKSDDCFIGSFLVYFDVFMIALRLCKLLAR